MRLTPNIRQRFRNLGLSAFWTTGDGRFFWDFGIDFFILQRKAIPPVTEYFGWHLLFNQTLGGIDNLKFYEIRGCLTGSRSSAVQCRKRVADPLGERR